MNGIVQYLSFCDQFLSLNIMYSGPSHTIACVKISFFKAKYSILWIEHVMFIYHPSSRFHLLGIVHNAGMILGV